MQIKHQLGKLTLGIPLRDIVEGQVRNGLQLLDVSVAHVLAVGAFPPVHKDPFDRLLAAASIVEGATLLTADTIFGQYPVTVLW